MDVNGLGQNLNVYSSNSNVSEYTQNNGEVLIPQIQQVEAKPSLENQTKDKQYTKSDLDNALKKINNFIKDEHVRAEYSVHKDFKTIMIKIVNEDTNEVILEVPPQKILDMVASICKQIGLIDKKA